MRRILFSAFILLSVNISAQSWVQVPDTNFQNFLTANYPAGAFMMSGGDFYIDSDHPIVQSENSLNLNNIVLSSLEGVQAFENLTYLSCDNCSLTSLPNLPSDLEELSFLINNISNLPGLPTSLKKLNCSSNLISSLPTLPNSLIQLNCSGNALTELPQLPGSLEVLWFGHNQITELPELPQTLISFSCVSNLLVALPDLPNLLEELYISNNLITELPELPDSLTILDCAHNELTTIPDLPLGLRYMYCEHNQIVEMPELPNSLELLLCNYNQIACFKNFPTSLTILSTYSNLFTCVPNYIAAMDQEAMNSPLCDENDPVNNPNGCESASGFNGLVFHDVNNDCIPSGEMNDGIPVALYNTNNELITITNSLFNGQYFFTATPGDYELKVQTSNIPSAIQVDCPVNNLSEATISDSSGLVNGGDFGLTCNGYDLGVQSVVSNGWVFPGQHHEVDVLVGDLTAQYGLFCASGISGEVTISISGPGTITFGGTPTNVTGNTATYSVADFGVLNAALFSSSIVTDTTASISDQFCVSVSVSSNSSGELNQGNNSYTYCYSVVNSYDPNVKETYPELLSPNFQDELTYTIHFQNTGDAPAMNIRLADQLDNNLNLSTLKIVNASSEYAFTLNAESRYLTIRFPNIMLPDSASDPSGSIGFVQYRIKPMPGLAVGATIPNTASIYFDYNAPIVTNTTENVVSMLSLNELTETTIKVYPNPATTAVIFESEEIIDQLEFYNLNGTKVKVVQPNTGKTQIDISSFENGVYIVKIYSETGVTNKRLVISK